MTADCRDDKDIKKTIQEAKNGNMPARKFSFAHIEANIQ